MLSGRVVLETASQRPAGQVVRLAGDGLLGPGLPVPGLALVAGQLLGEPTLAGDRPRRRGGGPGDRVVHLADRLPEHHLRVVEAVHQVVQVRADHVADAPQESHGESSSWVVG